MSDIAIPSQKQIVTNLEIQQLREMGLHFKQPRDFYLPSGGEGSN